METYVEERKIMARVRMAFDPGVRTGWAMMTANVMDVPGGKGRPGPVEEMYDLKLTSGTLRNEGDMQITQLQDHLSRWHTHDMHVIIERFDNRIRHVATELVSLEYIGVIKGWCVDAGVQFTMQTPAQAVGEKAFFSNDKLAACGVLSRPLKEYKDANDAMRHLLTWNMNHDPNMRVWILNKLKGI
jgi:hypothetical protein